MRTLSVDNVMALHQSVIERAGGSTGIRDTGLLESSVAQPLMTFGGEDLYPSITEKAAALGFSLIMNHPFVDGNKRIGHAAMEVFLVLNGLEITADVDEQEQVILSLASGSMERDAFVSWLQNNVAAIAL